MSVKHYAGDMKNTKFSLVLWMYISNIIYCNNLSMITSLAHIVISGGESRDGLTLLKCKPAVTQTDVKKPD